MEDVTAQGGDRGPLHKSTEVRNQQFMSLKGCDQNCVLKSDAKNREIKFIFLSNSM